MRPFLPLVLFLSHLTVLAPQAKANPFLRGKDFGSVELKGPDQGQQELIVAAHLRKAPEPELTQADVGRWIPTEYHSLNHPILMRTQMMQITGNPFLPESRDGNFMRDGINGKDQGSMLETSSDERFIRGRIFARAGVGILKSKTAQKIIRAQKHNPFVRAVNGVKLRASSREDRLPSSKDASQIAAFNAAEQTLDHRFRFDLQALRGQASVSYTGIVSSRLEYRVGDDVLRFSIEEQISENSRLALTHQRDRFEERQLLMYQISW